MFRDLTNIKRAISSGVSKARSAIRRLASKLKQQYLIMAACVVLILLAVLCVPAVYPTHSSRDTIKNHDATVAKKTTKTSAQTDTQLDDTQPGPSSSTNTPSTNTSSSKTSDNTAQVAALGHISFNLVISPSAVVIRSSSPTATFDVSAADGTKLHAPSASGNDLIFRDDSSTDLALQTWTMVVSRAYVSAVGVGDVTVSARAASGITYTGIVHVVYQAQPYIECSQGTISHTDDGTNTTYSTTFSLVPHGDVGNPSLHFVMGSGVGYVGGNYSYTANYNGQDNITLSAIVPDGELGSGFYFTDTMTTDGTVQGGCYLQYWAGNS